MLVLSRKTFSQIRYSSAIEPLFQNARNLKNQMDPSHPIVCQTDLPLSIMLNVYIKVRAKKAVVFLSMVSSHKNNSFNELSLSPVRKGIQRGKYPDIESWKHLGTIPSFKITRFLRN